MASSLGQAGVAQHDAVVPEHKAGLAVVHELHRVKVGRQAVKLLVALPAVATVRRPEQRAAASRGPHLQPRHWSDESRVVV